MCIRKSRAIYCFREVNEDNMVIRNISAEFLEDAGSVFVSISVFLNKNKNFKIFVFLA